MSETGKIEVFQDLIFKGSVSDHLALRNALSASAVGHWRHAKEKEKDIRASAGLHTDIIVFEREEADGLDAAAVFLSPIDNNFEITNIVPKNVGELGIHRYNLLLEDFAKQVAFPAAKKTGFQLEKSPAEQSLDNWLPQEAAAALRRFSGAANKSTGSSHPYDRARWFDFIFKVHEDSGSFDTELLRRWLIEVEGWHEEKAHELALEYEFALSLLKYADTHRP